MSSRQGVFSLSGGSGLSGSSGLFGLSGWVVRELCATDETGPILAFDRLVFLALLALSAYLAHLAFPACLAFLAYPTRVDFLARLASHAQGTITGSL